MNVGDGLKVTQIRLGTARLTHCMRWLGLAQALARRSRSTTSRVRESHGRTLADARERAVAAGRGRDADRDRPAADDARRGEARRGRLRAQGDLDGEGRRRRRAAPGGRHRASSSTARAATRRTRVLEWIYRYARQARLVDGASEVHKRRARALSAWRSATSSGGGTAHPSGVRIGRRTTPRARCSGRGWSRTPDRRARDRGGDNARERRLIDRRTFVRGAAAALAGVPLAAAAQHAGSVPSRRHARPRRTSTSTRRSSMACASWGTSTGAIIVIERQSADGDYARLPRSRRSSSQLKPRVIAGDRHAGVDRGEGGDDHDPDRDRCGGRSGRRRYRRQSRAPGRQRHGNGRAPARRGRQAGRAHAPDAAAQSRAWPCSGIPANVVFQQQALGEALISASRLRIVAQPIGVRSREDLERTFAALGSDRPDAVLVLPIR